MPCRHLVWLVSRLASPSQTKTYIYNYTEYSPDKLTCNQVCIRQFAKPTLASHCLTDWPCFEPDSETNYKCVYLPNVKVNFFTQFQKQHDQVVQDCDASKYMLCTFVYYHFICISFDRQIVSKTKWWSLTWEITVSGQQESHHDSLHNWQHLCNILRNRFNPCVCVTP